MLMIIYDLDGFSDEFESKVIENMIKRSLLVQWVKEEGDKQFYTLKKKSVLDLIKELEGERVRQREKSLFKGTRTRTLKELEIVIGILYVLQSDPIVSPEEDIAMFVVNNYVEMLDI